jgi:hypothetical protein
LAWFGLLIAVSFKYFGYYLTVVPAGAIRAPQGRRPGDLGSALEGKLSTDLDAQVFIPHLSETRRRARCDRSPNRDRRTQRNGPSTVVPIRASSPGGFTSASAVNWSRNAACGKSAGTRSTDVG